MKEKKMFRLSLNEAVLLGAFVFVALIGVVANENFLTVRNILSVFQQMSEMGIMALGLTIVILTGGIDLSCGSVMGLCAVTSGICLTSGIGVVPTLLISMALSLVCGIMNGIIVAWVKIPPMIATLGTQMFFYGLALVLSEGNSISGIPQSFYFLGQDKFLGIPVQAVLFLTFWVILLIMLRKKRLGKYIYAIGNNSKAALYSGVAVTKILVVVYMLGAFLSCIAGNIQVARVATARADMGSTFLMQCISAVVLGGTSMNGGIGGVTGTVIGITIFAMIGNIMNLVGITSFWQQLATGSILILVIVFNRVAESGKFKWKKSTS